MINCRSQIIYDVFYNKFIYNQNVGIEVKFKQVGQILLAINEELIQEIKIKFNTTFLSEDKYKKQLIQNESQIESLNQYANYNSIAIDPLDYIALVIHFYDIFNTQQYKQMIYWNKQYTFNLFFKILIFVFFNYVFFY
ncbi:unnamed protein product [Paramecium octaurelia]|uniref:Transmembrane protein n=1 Tax=Paramecium octaurelia TaxID=43137 RepID=A0A8S1TLB1_PAROT|nr:unnamed protein product [Paramecium octaurelia]